MYFYSLHLLLFFLPGLSLQYIYFFHFFLEFCLLIFCMCGEVQWYLFFIKFFKFQGNFRRDVRKPVMLGKGIKVGWPLV